jgi:hypothetical protein
MTRDLVEQVFEEVLSLIKYWKDKKETEVTTENIESVSREDGWVVVQLKN